MRFANQLGPRLGPRDSGVTAFTPASLFPADGAWYDPSDLSTMFQNSGGTGAVAADGDPVGYIADKSGNGNHLIQATAGARPLYKTSGGLHWLQFDGVDDSLADTFGAALTQPLNRLSALRFDTWALNRYVFDGASSDTVVLRQHTVTPDIQGFAGTLGTEVGAPLGVAHVVSELYNGAGSSLRVDATETASAMGANNMDGLTVGLRPGGAVPCPVKVFGIIIREGAMTAGQLSDARAYLAAKGGI